MENETGALILTTATGQELPIRFGLSAIRRLCKHFQCALGELQDKINESIKEDQIGALLLMARVGAESDAALNNRIFDFNEDQILSALDKPGAYIQLMDAFGGSFTAFSDASEKVADTQVGKAKASTKAGKTSGEK